MADSNENTLKLYNVVVTNESTKRVVLSKTVYACDENNAVLRAIYISPEGTLEDGLKVFVRPF